MKETDDAENTTLWMHAMNALLGGDPLPLVALLNSQRDLPVGFRSALASLLDPRPTMAGPRLWGSAVLKVGKVDRRKQGGMNENQIRGLDLMLKHIQAGATVDEAAQVVEEAGILSARRMYDLKRRNFWQFNVGKPTWRFVRLYCEVMGKALGSGEECDDAKRRATEACETAHAELRAEYKRTVSDAAQKGIPAHKAIP